MKNKLIPDYEVLDQNALSDLLLIMAMNVEESMITAGATPGKDYSHLDLYKLAAPFALEIFKSRDDTTFFTTSRSS
ncbi:MAG: hypothetical protein KA144_00495 [Xanthomonadaceae bacterium]|nr:hypothetical protein [Xanthomonadaceae bacterium]